MSAPAQSGPKWRNSPFSRNSPSPSPGPTPNTGRPKSALISSPLSDQQHISMGHSRNHSFSPLGNASAPARSNSTRLRSNSHRNGTPGGTFAPQFITSDGSQDGPEKVRAIEGENDFSGKRYVWLKDSKSTFVRGWVVEELDAGKLLVQCDDGSVRMKNPKNCAKLTFG